MFNKLFLTIALIVFHSNAFGTTVPNITGEWKLPNSNTPVVLTQQGHMVGGVNAGEFVTGYWNEITQRFVLFGIISRLELELSDDGRTLSGTQFPEKGGSPLKLNGQVVIRSLVKQD